MGKSVAHCIKCDEEKQKVHEPTAKTSNTNLKRKQNQSETNNGTDNRYASLFVVPAFLIDLFFRQFNKSDTGYIPLDYELQL